MDGKVRHESPRLHREQRPKDGTMSHGNMTTSSSNSSSATTIQPGSSDSELCRLMSSGRSLESLADDEEAEAWTPDIEDESYEQRDINRCTVQMNSPTEEAGETSADEAAEYEDEPEDYDLVIEKRFQQLYGFKTPYNCCLLDDEWCNQVFKPCANVGLSWSNTQPFSATAQEQFTNQHFPSIGQVTTETEMASISSFLQVSNNKSNECKYKTSQQLAESNKVSYEIPETDTTSQKPIEMLQPHEKYDDDIRNAVAKEIAFTENYTTPRTGSKTSLRVEINSQSAIDEWTATSDSPSQHDSAQFASHGSQLLDTGNNYLEYSAGTTEHKLAEDIPADTTEDDIPDQILPINEWQVNGDLNNHPLNFLYLINELALMNDFVVMSNLVDTRPLTDNDRFAVGMVRRERCTIEEIDSGESTDRSKSESPTAVNNYVKNPTNDDSGKRLTEKQENEICEYTRSVTTGQNESTPKFSPKRPEEYEQDVSYSAELKRASSQFLSGEDSETSIQGQHVPGNYSAKIISNMLRNERMKNNNSPPNETASIPQITDTEKTRKSRIPRRKSVGPAFNCKPLRQPSCSMIETIEGTPERSKPEDLARGGESEAMPLSKNSRIPCDNRKTTTRQQLTDNAGYCKHVKQTGLHSNKSENQMSSTLLDGQQSEGSCSSVQEHQTDNLKLPPIRLNRRERESESNVMPPSSLAANENTPDLFEIHGQKSKGHLKNKHQQLRGHLLAKLTAIPARKQQASSTFIKLPSLSLQSTPIHKQSHPLAVRRPYTPPNRNVLEARAQWPQFYTSHQSDIDRGLPRRIALKDLPSLKKVPGFSYGVYE